MEPRSTNTRTFSIAVPGIDQPITSDDVSCQYPEGLFSSLPVSNDAGRFDYSEGRLGALLGQTSPVRHPNLYNTIYAHRMDVSCVPRLSPAWAVASVICVFGSVASSFLYKYGSALNSMEEGSLMLASVILMGLAGASYYAVTRNDSREPVDHSYSYMESFAGLSTHIKWSDYWQGMLIEGCDRKKLKQVSSRARDFGFRLRQLRKPRLSQKSDGSPLSGEDIRAFMMYNNDSGFASITRLFWAIEVARRETGKSLKMEIRAVPTNAQFFLKLGEALTGNRPEGLSLPRLYSRPLADLLDGAAFYAGLANSVPTQAAALASLLGRYYDEHRGRNNASLMMHSMKYALLGKWRSAFDSHLSAMKRPIDGSAVPEQQLVSAIHYLSIARLIQERVIDGYGHEVIPGGYAYAYSAARAFDALAYDMIDAAMHCQLLQARAVDIMRVMSNNGPFVEFR